MMLVYSISRFNALPESEKVKYDKKALSRAVGMLLLGINFSTFPFVMAMQRSMEWPIDIGIVVCCHCHRKHSLDQYRGMVKRHDA